MSATPTPTARLRWRGGAMSDETRAFLQRRVGLFGLVAGGLSAIFAVHRATVELTAGRVSVLAEAGYLAHVVAAALLLGAWIATRVRSWTLHGIVAIDTLAFFGSSVAYVVMASGLPLVVRPELVLALALTYGLVARAAFVPDAAWKTAAYGLVLAAMSAPAVYASYLDATPAIVAAVAEGQGEDEVQGIARLMGIYAVAWLVLTTLLATAVAHVVHGLRREVFAARRLGQYVLEERIGAGGMGEVFRARHVLLKRPTAVKLLAPRLLGEEAVARFEREVTLTARLTHPNTVTVFDYGRSVDGVFYYAMELIDGANLAQIVETVGPMPPERVLHVMDQVAGALGEAHASGLVHRDVKASNVMLCERGGVHDVVKVLDFGLVKDLAHEASIKEDEAEIAAGVVTGTPHVMSPEALRSPELVDGRSDLYSLGAVAWHLLTGHPVFAGFTAEEIFAGHLARQPRRPSEVAGRAFDPDLEALLLACLAKSPDDRPQGASELRRRVARCRDFGRWDEAQAAAWWREHGEALREAGRSRGAAEAPTVGAEPTLLAVARRPSRPR